MMRSFVICLLIPICIAVYIVLFKDIKEKGLPFSGKVEVTEEISNLVSAQSSEEKKAELKVDDEPSKLEEKQTEQQELLVGNEQIAPPVEEIDFKPIPKKLEQLRYEETEGGVLVYFVTKDEHGKIIEESYKTINNEQVIQPNSDRYLEILAEEFVRMHFDQAGLEMYYSGTVVSRDEQYAKVIVVKTEWKANFYKEKFNVLIDINNGKPKPISMQQAKR